MDWLAREKIFWNALFQRKIDSKNRLFQKKLREIDSNPSSAYNFYNYYLAEDENRSFNLLDQYFHSKKLVVLSKKENSRPLFIDNIQAGSTVKHFRSNKKISVVITAYNEASLIASAVSSLIEQSYKNIELLFVDDASSDNSVEIFKQTCKEKHFDDYTIISMHQNSGPFVTRNIGIKYASGDYITFHDADDWAHPQRFEEQVRKFDDENIVASISQLVRIKANGVFFSKHIYPLNRIAMVSLMIKREVLETLGYFHTDLLGADTEYFERIKYFYGRERIDNIKKVLTFAAHRPNSRTTSIETGVPEFGENPLRKRHTELLQTRLFEMVNGYRAYYVAFDEHKHSYTIDQKEK